MKKPIYGLFCKRGVVVGSETRDLAAAKTKATKMQKTWKQTFHVHEVEIKKGKKIA